MDPDPDQNEVDPDPDQNEVDPDQNEVDPKHCLVVVLIVSSIPLYIRCPYIFLCT